MLNKAIIIIFHCPITILQVKSVHLLNIYSAIIRLCCDIIMESCVIIVLYFEPLSPHNDALWHHSGPLCHHNDALCHLSTPFPITMLHWEITMIHCAITLLSCDITMLHFNIANSFALQSCTVIQYCILSSQCSTMTSQHSFFHHHSVLWNHSDPLCHYSAILWHHNVAFWHHNTPLWHHNSSYVITILHYDITILPFFPSPQGTVKSWWPIVSSHCFTMLWQCCIWHTMLQHANILKYCDDIQRIKPNSGVACSEPQQHLILFYSWKAATKYKTDGQGAVGEYC